MSKLDQPTNLATAPIDNGLAELNQYRLSAPAKSSKDAAGASKQVEPVKFEYPDSGSSDSDKRILRWRPSHGHGKASDAWFDAKHKLENVPIIGNAYTVQNGDCLETLARRSLLGHHQKVDGASTNQQIAKLVELNKEHYQGLTHNPHYIRDGWKLHLDTMPSVSEGSDKPRGDGKTHPPSSIATGDKATQSQQTVLPSAPASKESTGINAGSHQIKIEKPASNLALEGQHKADTAPDKKCAKEPAGKHEGVLDELWEGSKKAYDSSKKAIEAHPWLSGTIAALGVVTIGLVCKGRLRQFIKAEGELSKVAQQTERDAVLIRVGEIPDVARPQIEKLVTSSVPAEFEKFASEYRTSLTDLRGLPSHYEAGQSESISELAERVLKSRSSITGERISVEAVEKESLRIKALNPDLPEAIGGQQVLVHDEASLAKLAETTQFKHVPQIGQFLKQYGVSEESIQEALKIQNAQPKEGRQLIGQILTENNLATKEQVHQAFGQQSSLKDVLKKVRLEMNPPPQ